MKTVPRTKRVMKVNFAELVGHEVLRIFGPNVPCSTWESLSLERHFFVTCFCRRLEFCPLSSYLLSSVQDVSTWRVLFCIFGSVDFDELALVKILSSRAFVFAKSAAANNKRPAHPPGFYLFMSIFSLSKHK